MSQNAHGTPQILKNEGSFSFHLTLFTYIVTSILSKHFVHVTANIILILTHIQTEFSNCYCLCNIYGIWPVKIQCLMLARLRNRHYFFSGL